MTISNWQRVDPVTPAVVAAPDLPCWYALCTSSRHEKQIATLLRQRNIDFFLPLYDSVRRWKDRRVRLQLPLFPGYVFVNISLQRRLEVLTIPGTVRFVMFHGRPAAVPEGDLLTLRSGLVQGLPVQPHPYLKAGRRVRVCGGPLAGAEGILLRKKERYRLVLSVDVIMRSIAIEVDGSDVEPISWV